MRLADGQWTSFRHQSVLKAKRSSRDYRWFGTYAQVGPPSNQPDPSKGRRFAGVLYRGIPATASLGPEKPCPADVNSCREQHPMHSPKLGKREPLLGWRHRRPLLQFPTLVPQHGGHQLPRRPRRVAPRCRNSDHAVMPRVGIEADKPGLPRRWISREVKQSATGIMVDWQDSNHDPFVRPGSFAHFGRQRRRAVLSQHS